MLARQLARFEPFSQLDWNQLLTLAAHCRTITVAPGRWLSPGALSQGVSCFLLAGRVSESRGGCHRTFAHTDPRARRALLSYPADVRLKVRTESRVSLLVVDLAPIHFLLDTKVSIPAATLLPGDSRSWMERLLASGLLTAFTPLQLQEFFRTFVTCEWPDGGVVIDPGSRADCLYVVKHGEVRVEFGDECALLGPGAVFGQDGLIQGKPRNARVVVGRKGVIGCLPERDFWRFFDPLWQQTCPASSLQAVSEQAGDPTDGQPPCNAENRASYCVLWIGQTLPETAGLPHAPDDVPLCHLPLPELRRGLADLDTTRHYLVAGASPRAQVLAVFLLVEAGFSGQLLQPDNDCGGQAGTVRSFAQVRSASIDSARSTETG